MTGPKWPVAIAVFLTVVLLVTVLAAGIRTAEPATTLTSCEVCR